MARAPVILTLCLIGAFHLVQSADECLATHGCDVSDDDLEVQVAEVSMLQVQGGMHSSKSSSNAVNQMQLQKKKLQAREARLRLELQAIKAEQLRLSDELDEMEETKVASQTHQRKHLKKKRIVGGVWLQYGADAGYKCGNSGGNLALSFEDCQSQAEDAGYPYLSYQSENKKCGIFPDCTEGYASDKPEWTSWELRIWTQIGEYDADAGYKCGNSGGNLALSLEDCQDQAVTLGYSFISYNSENNKCGIFPGCTEGEGDKKAEWTSYELQGP